MNQPLETADYNENTEEAKNPGALLGLIMGAYPVILVAGILLIIGIMGIRSAFRSTFPNSRPVQIEPESPTPTLPKNPN